MSTRRLLQNTIQSNLVAQNALAAQAIDLEAQLKDLDHLIETVNKGEELPDESFQAEFQIPGSKRATAPISSFELLAPASPCYKEASQRAHYLRWTSLHPMKGKEVEVLADAVKKENMRLEAYRVRDNPSAPPIDIVHNVQGIDWSIVAEKVSDHALIKRTPDECRIQWVAKLHPKVNHGDWTQDELDKLHNLTAPALATGQKVDWSGIAKELGTNRVPIDCMKQAITRPRHQWDTNADQKLLEAVEIFGTNNWNLVARHVSPYATTSQCQTRYVRSLNPSIKHEPWTPEEDTRLQKAVDVFNNSWIDVAGVLPGRTNEQCRERWAEIGAATEGEKGPWSEVEDQQLLEAVKVLGKKWKMVSEKLGGRRTGPNCRLRYNRLMKRQAKQDNSTVSAPSASEPGSIMQIQAPPTDHSTD
ncbi:hypothetical protein AGABI1DRAFT_128158 [Agaricus bisporus var. burnettii JB137-S8]|uniref:Uncharacterized protein n=1 Tax=Agaricus bisporus var. burnettii (strain JB137-S8 / ATCC MYA-4627 / FGSC 10392) TaxID=597362 RepID=K5W108_AGABU|nr:uncharacterized protein AGABI1DRAFT_128158 [Agaricus bisporus var. burnettii JB137-S8]EKM80484.1 hypothetical protein AGABI1DRAFT_128158 [Agaricus bisporus var. burnettii JB137-S8]